MRPALRVGSKVGRYTIGKVLGAGGFAITYLALNPKLDQVLVIKELFPSDLVTRSTVNHTTVEALPGRSAARFEKHKLSFIEETKLLVTLQGERNLEVVSVVGFEECNGTVYMVMSHVDGQDLDAKVRANGPLRDSELKIALSGLVSALELVHSKDIRHLDVKPANILWRPEGRVTLIDFGNASAASGDIQRRVSIAGETEGYSPPEVREQDPKPTQDIYSMGATVFYLVTGSHPPSAQARVSGTGFSPSLDWVAKNVSATVAEFIYRSMAIDPKDRPQTMVSVRAMLGPELEASLSWLDVAPQNPVGRRMLRVRSKLESGANRAPQWNTVAGLLPSLWFFANGLVLEGAIAAATDAFLLVVAIYRPDLLPLWLVLLVLQRIVFGLFADWLLYRRVDSEVSTLVATRGIQALALAQWVHNRLAPSGKWFAIGLLVGPVACATLAIAMIAHQAMRRDEVASNAMVQRLLCRVQSAVQANGIAPQRTDITIPANQVGGRITAYEMEGSNVVITLAGPGAAEGRKLRWAFDASTNGFVRCENLDVPDHMLPIMCTPKGRMPPLTCQ